MRFAKGKSALDAEATRLVRGFVPAMKGGSNAIDVTGYVDRTGDRAANETLAKARAVAVRDLLVAEGLPAGRVRLTPPRDIVGSGSDDEARRVEIAAGR